MRLILMSSSLSLVLLATSLGAQSGPAQNPSQPAAMKKPDTQSTQTRSVATRKTTHRAARSKYAARNAKRRKGSKRPAYRPEFTQNTVEVINGASTQKVVFNNQKPGEQTKNEPSQLKVEVMNGTSTDTRYFYVDKNQPAAQGNTAKPKQPVVVGVQSSDTRVVGGNKHPVVTAITAVGPGDATSASGGGQKLTTGVAPQPKRPEYQPETH